jgi:DNA-binding CsgD family transcriptional regulator/PAS domain-containing protein
MESLYSNPEYAFGGSQQLLELIEMIYATVQNQSLWPAVMEQIGVAMDGESLAIYATFPGSGVPAVLALREMPQDVWNSYADYYASVNPILAAAYQKLSAHETWFSERVISDAELEHTECYADFFKPNDMHYCAGGVIPLPNLPLANLSCQRPKRKGPFDARADVVFQTLKPHLQRALVLHYQFATLQAHNLGWSAALDAFGHAVFGLDAHGKVVFTNRAAESMAQNCDALRLVQGKLVALEPHCNRTMQQLVSGAVAAGKGNGLSSGGSTLIARKGDRAPLQLTASPFRAPLVLGKPAVAALVFVSDPEAVPPSRSAVMRALYGLTPAEIRVAALLLQGTEIRELADRLGITLETGRLHVKRILGKTGCSRQADLARRMLSLPGDL